MLLLWVSWTTSLELLMLVTSLSQFGRPLGNVHNGRVVRVGRLSKHPIGQYYRLSGAVGKCRIHRPQDPSNGFAHPQHQRGLQRCASHGFEIMRQDPPSFIKLAWLTSNYLANTMVSSLRSLYRASRCWTLYNDHAKKNRSQRVDEK